MHERIPRMKCPNCKSVTQVKVKWARQLTAEMFLNSQLGIAKRRNLMTIIHVREQASTPNARNTLSIISITLSA